MKVFKQILGLCLDKYFILTLSLIVIISSGQMIHMNVWEDDQALFFKLAHIQDPVGYFGPGPFGVSPYKYAATPFIPIFNLFGFNSYAFFTYLFLVYFITVLTVYKTFKFVLGDKAGKISAFLYACGYVTSESFFRMANSMTTSISIILSCLIVACLWKFSRTNKYLFYFFAVFFYFLSMEFAMSRMHYFFLTIVLFEFIFLSFRKGLHSLSVGILRLLPFFLIFYNYVILGGDPRTANTLNSVRLLLQGQFYYLYGFLASFNSLILPDWFLGMFLRNSQPKLFVIQRFIPLFTLFLLILVLSIFPLILRKYKLRKLLIPFFIAAALGLFIFFYKTFSTPLLFITTTTDIYKGAMGAIILLLLFLLVFVVKQKKLYSFMFLWLLGNITAYWAYSPTIGYSSVERYLAHSFLALVGVVGLISIALPPSLLGRIGFYLILFLGLGNMYNSYLYQKTIVQNRSLPTKAFFNDFKTYVPTLSKEGIIFIDVSPDARNLYKDAIGAAMMPDTTAFAWRYGIDRYDIKLTSDFNKFIQISTDSAKLSNIHTFWYSKKGLVDTTSDISSYLSRNLKLEEAKTDLPKTSKIEIKETGQEFLYTQNDILVNFKKPIKSSIPIKLSFNIQAKNLSSEQVNFPLTKQGSRKEDVLEWSNPEIREMAFDYLKEKESFYSESHVSVSSEWNERNLENLTDKDPNTAWQSDRVIWKDKFSFIKIELPSMQTIARMAWINGFALTTPTNITIQSSMEGNNWEDLAHYQSVKKIEDDEIQVIDFKPTETRYLRMVITDTVTGDSPAVAEIWAIPSKFLNLNIQKAEKFMKDPFLVMPSYQIYLDTLNNTNNVGTSHVYWQNNSNPGWQTTVNSFLKLSYDNQFHNYEIVIPPEGTQISKLLISNITIPGELELRNIKVEPAYISF